MAPAKRKGKQVKPHTSGHDQANIENNENKYKLKFLKQKLKSERKAWKSICDGISTSLKVISLLAIFLSFAIYLKIRSNSAKIASATKESSILHLYAEAVLEFSETIENMMEGLKEKPLDDLMKLELRPIQERVASLRTQTSIYEKMERIPGGPKSFISSTLKELETLKEKLISLDSTVQKIVNENYIEKKNLAANMNNATNSKLRLNAMYTSDNHVMFHILRNQGLELFAINDTINDELEIEKANMTFSKTDVQLKKAGVTPKILAAKLESLSKLFAEREELDRLMREVPKSLGFSDEFMMDEANEDFLNDQEILIDIMERHRSMCEKIFMAIKRDKKYFNLTVRWITEAMIMIAYLDKPLTKVEQQNYPYFHLRNVIMNDIDKLEIRVEGLRS